MFGFSKLELGIDLSSEFREDDTWRVFLDELYEFTRSHRERVQEMMRTRGEEPVECRNCREEVVLWHGGSCDLCGHWQDFEDTDIEAR